MIRDTGQMSLSDCDDANIPVVCFLHEPDRPNGMWSWTAVNFMPRKERCGGTYKLEADTKEEIMEELRKWVIPLYETALTNMNERGYNYYWKLP
jgi:hypothetical protein